MNSELANRNNKCDFCVVYKCKFNTNLNNPYNKTKKQSKSNVQKTINQETVNSNNNIISELSLKYEDVNLKNTILQDKVDNMLLEIEELKNQVSLATSKTDEYGITVYDPNVENTNNLVLKKSIFGKEKWVEDKQK